MAQDSTDYDPRYLAGVLFFNAHDFFEAHEVWEDLWHVTPAPERRFYQGLIQAAVALFHFGNGNVRGAVRLYHSSRDYMSSFGPRYHGLDVSKFWDGMQECFAGVLGTPESATPVKLDETRIPTITLDPPPAEWPDPESLLPEDH